MTSPTVSSAATAARNTMVAIPALVMSLLGWRATGPFKGLLRRSEIVLTLRIHEFARSEPIAFLI